MPIMMIIMMIAWVIIMMIIMIIIMMIAMMIIMMITMRVIMMATKFRYLGSKAFDVRSILEWEAISRLLGAGLGKSRQV